MLGNIFEDNMGKLVLRITLGVLMLFHGVAKIMHPGTLDFIGNNLASMGVPAIFSYAVFIGEVIAPIMIIVGYYARVGGALLMINMLIAIGLVHLGDIFSLTQHGGLKLELQIFYLIGGLLIIMFGSGKWAIKSD